MRVPQVISYTPSIAYLAQRVNRECAYFQTILKITQNNSILVLNHPTIDNNLSFTIFYSMPILIDETLKRKLQQIDISRNALEVLLDALARVGHGKITINKAGATVYYTVEESLKPG